MSDDKPTDQKSFDEILENSPDPRPRAALPLIMRTSLMVWRSLGRWAS